MNEKTKVTKENARKILNIVEEWVNNQDAELYFDGYLVTWSPSFDSSPEYYEIRYPKKTIIVNGVEVPAPAKKTSKHLQIYFVSDVNDEDFYIESYWDNDEIDNIRLKRGLVYLNKEDAISRSKAMLMFTEK